MNEVQKWLVVMTKPKMELAAKGHLTRQGFKVYLPLWADLKRHTGGWQKVRSPMFPRYLFVQSGYPEQAISPIRSTRGVSQAVHFGRRPAWAGGSLIEEIRALEAARNANSDELAPFKKGDQVIVLKGPFKGVSAKVLSSDQQRVTLLFRVLGKLQELEFEAGICRAW